MLGILPRAAVLLLNKNTYEYQAIYPSNCSAFIKKRIGNINSVYSAGLRLDLRTRRAQRPEDIALHWTHQYDFSDDIFARGIAIIDKNVSSNGADEKPTTVATRFSITKKLDRGVSSGAEMFNNYGKFNNLSKTEDQEHQFGPFFLYRKQGWYLYARYLSGLTTSTDDHNFQFRVGKSF